MENLRKFSFCSSYILFPFLLLTHTTRTFLRAEEPANFFRLRLVFFSQAAPAPVVF